MKTQKELVGWLNLYFKDLQPTELYDGFIAVLFGLLSDEYTIIREIKTQYKEPTSPMDIMSINDGKEVIDLLDDNLDSDEILEAILTFLETKSKVKIMKPIKKFLENLLEEVIGYSVDCGICNVTSHYSLDTPYGTCQCS